MKAKDIIFEPIHEKCKGCFFINSSKGRLGYAKCRAYFRPTAWWKRGNCPLATHTLVMTEAEFEKMKRIQRVRIGQQKGRRKGK